MMTNIQTVDPEESLACLELVLVRADPIGKGAALVSTINDEQAIALLVAPVVVTLEQALWEGYAPDLALRHWKAAVQALLPAQRRARDRVCLVSEAAMRADPEEASNAIAACIGRAPQGLLPKEVATEVVIPSLALIARLVLAADPEAIRLNSELEAATLAWPGMKNWEDSQDIGELFDRYRQELAKASRPEGLQQLRLEMAAQREELHAFELQLEGEALLRAQNQEIEQSREELARELISAEARLAETEAELQRMREAHDGIVAWVARMERSRSWRITAPLRAINRLRS